MPSDATNAQSENNPQMQEREDGSLQVKMKTV